MNAQDQNPGEPLTLASLRCEHFAPLLGEFFTLSLPEGGTLQIRLIGAHAAKHVPPPGLRHGFSLAFRCPELPANQHLRQGMYPLEHPALGSFDYFITPITPDEEGVRYESIFG